MDYPSGVKEQYEAYPYPPRNPEDEKTRLENSWHDFLEVINFYCFKGKNNFSGEFRALVAGGGTGDQTIFLAEQLRHNRNAEVVHQDISAKSLDIAKQRAAVRKLTNIRWSHQSILDLPSLQLGQFDYINCAGVLHHLEDPSAGLRALHAALKPTGAMMIMLYGKYGRTGVYQMQELMRRMNLNENDRHAKIENTRAILQALPKTNWFKRGEDLISDHKEFGEAGIYDLFLHSQDKPFTVDEIYELVEGCDLQVIELIERGRSKYMVESYTPDNRILNRIRRMIKREQQGIAELLAGDMIVHNLYIARDQDRVAALDDLRNVPFFFLDPPDIPEMIRARPDEEVRVKSALFDATIVMNPTKYVRLMFEQLDGEQSLKEIFDHTRKKAGLTEQQLPNAELLNEFKPIYERFNAVGWMLLRHKSVGKFRTLAEMQRPPG